MKAVFIGSISTLADTSELQRSAFNKAFAEAGLDWHWSEEAYRDLLTQSGGQARIAAYAHERDTQLDAQALHARKSEIFQQELRAGSVPMRDHTQALLEYVRTHGLRAAFVSGTERQSLEALLEGFGGASALGFDLVTARGDAPGKPDAGLYAFALDRMGMAAEEVLAVEDNLPGVQAAQAAGITALAYPNVNTAHHDFGDVPDVSRWSEYLSLGRDAA